MSSGRKPRKYGTRVGRPPGQMTVVKRALADLAKGYAEDAFDTLRDICMNGESEAARVSAAVAILDRAYGKPSQVLRHQGSIGTYDLSKVSDEELDTLGAILGAVAEPGADTGGAEETHH